MTVETKDYLEIKEYAQKVGEPDWFTALRLKALEALPQLTLPSFEKIKYQRWPIQLKGALKQRHSKPELLQQLSLKDAAHLVVQLGQETVTTKGLDLFEEQGVIICDWQTALREHPALVKKYFMKKAIKVDEDLLTAQHVAYLTSGLFVYIPKNTVLKDPLTSYFVQDATEKQDYVHHVIIVAEENSEFSYLENLTTLGQTETTANIIVEVIAGTNSHVKFASVDRLGRNTTTYLNRRGHLGTNAKIDWSMGMMNDGNIVGDFDSDLVGDGSHSEVKVVAISTGNQVQGIDTRVTNSGKHTIGHILQHGVILSRSTLTFNGIGHIIKGAKGADAQQESRVLMLSTKAKGDANPILLIDDNDVTAGHAASVGRVNQEQLYYLMSRGLPKKIAERLVIRGFLGPVLAEIPSQLIREQLKVTIERKLVDGQKDE
ncbi:Fe-S cluster assembly protein SufD [Liquorilactobacillus satsumensis]|uniref:Fe-S cluster assembly protein SufD n=1 Tax=Liquorilactobacillus satsumensis TaxID=259059 RepID=UPI001E3B40C9|nr:Fe-S cluster assembly protein SufD [Liquorilactobacillus satsumensis]MCC7667327.1 Fe-S cluster assembly protein SufD [Liquorilactobacillus satsumensis]MCP9312372.1 Fe-S cluster assembly protein SufD [Liquorilactobacillus satsumensis]MCP9327653.1 Fe-S cluster assembly protein SufD [Liquorilactobacillus satsumensis]MCP9357075.1 Fe-S cluster assembly protein SufD [Liquorilactobacillus satsumensis]MCP9359624.1 Fe-S cluster assembly protein SufD [Liquorilactobacillus satsumensis]